MAMGTSLQEWNWEPLIDAELDKWLLVEDETRENEINDPSLMLNQSETSNGSSSNFEDIEIDKNWFEEFPLFEEIEPLEEAKCQSFEEFQFLEANSSGGEKFSFHQNGGGRGIPSEFYVNSYAVEDFLSSSMENATFVFSDDQNKMLYIQSHPNSVTSNFDLKFEEKNLQADRENPKSRENEKCFSFEIAQSDFFPPRLSTAETEKKISLTEKKAGGEKFKNSAMESDQWESDTSSSSFEGRTGSSSSVTPPEEESDDPEWKPETKPPKSAGNSKRKAPGGGSVRHQEEKRLRKKEQNKSAATRYRLKKKAEMEELLREEEELKRKRNNLEEKMADVQNKVRCLKGLMRDLFKSEGHI